MWMWMCVTFVSTKKTYKIGINAENCPDPAKKRGRSYFRVYYAVYSVRRQVGVLTHLGFTDDQLSKPKTIASTATIQNLFYSGTQ